MDISNEKLAGTVSRYEELSMLMTDPMILADQKRYLELVQEFHELEPLALNIKRLTELKEELEANKKLLTDTDDQEFRELIREEINGQAAEIDRLQETISRDLVPADPNDNKNVIMEIRAGAGGDEAALFVGDLYRMYAAFADTKGYSLEVIEANEIGIGGFKEIVFEIQGQGAYSQLKFESGVHRVQRVPVTEAGGRIHTSTVTVAVLPEVADVEVEIDPGDLEIDTYRASGAGGQHVNKTSSAIRITHVPTGLVVTCQDQRSQHKNKEKAMKVLRSKLYEMEEEKRAAEIASDRKGQVGTGDRSERIRTYNYPQGRVTDHRIGLTLYQLNQVLDGDLSPFILALQAADHEARVQAES